jgi:hypothetical protein
LALTWAPALRSLTRHGSGRPALTGRLPSRGLQPRLTSRRFGGPPALAMCSPAIPSHVAVLRRLPSGRSGAPTGAPRGVSVG